MYREADGKILGHAPKRGIRNGWGFGLIAAEPDKRACELGVGFYLVCRWAISDMFPVHKGLGVLVWFYFESVGSGDRLPRWPLHKLIINFETVLRSGASLKQYIKLA